MKLRDHHRPAATLLATLAIVVGLAACASSDASGDSTTPAPAATDAVVTSATTAPPATTVPAATVPATTVPAATVPDATVPAATTITEVPTTAPSETVITDADVADLEQQLDEIDELLAGVDADLSQD